MNKKFTITLLGTVATCLVGTSSVFAATGVVTGNSVRIREEASTDSSIIETVTENTEVEVISEEGDWYQVTYNDQDGYIHKDYIDVDLQENEQNEENADDSSNTENEDATDETTDDNNTDQTEDDAEEVQLGDTLNSDTTLYLTPSFSSSEIGSLEENTKISIEKTISNWSYVSFKNQEGWIPNYKLMNIATTNDSENTEKEDEQTDESAVEINKEGYLSSSSANLREGPGTDYDTIGGIAENEVITVLEEEDGWYRVETVDDLTGYVLKSLVTIGEPETTSRSGIRTVEAIDLDEVKKEENANNKKESDSKKEPSSSSSSSTSSKRKELVAYAKKYLGYKYVSGGSSPKTGFDCSGFTKYVYGQFGYSLSRTSSGQASNGTHVDKDDLKQGDLLIFTGHVGIYIGDNKFIHASNPSDGVKITSLSDSYYVRNYIDARRIIK